MIPGPVGASHGSERASAGEGGVERENWSIQSSEDKRINAARHFCGDGGESLIFRADSNFHSCGRRGLDERDNKDSKGAASGMLFCCASSFASAPHDSMISAPRPRLPPVGVGS